MKTLDQPPSIDMCAKWASALETKLQADADALAAEYQQEQERIEARERARADYLSASDADRAQAVADLKERSRPQEATPFVPARQYTQAEIDRMSSDEYGVKVLGRNRIEDRNQSSNAPAYERNRRDIMRKHIMRKPATRDARVNAALRRQVLEGEL